MASLRITVPHVRTDAGEASALADVGRLVGAGVTGLDVLTGAALDIADAVLAAAAGCGRLVAAGGPSSALAASSSMGASSSSSSPESPVSGDTKRRVDGSDSGTPARCSCKDRRRRCLSVSWIVVASRLAGSGQPSALGDGAAL